MSNIKKAFATGKAFIPFITCGDPDLATPAAAVRACAENGASLIELGIPFSAPTSEGRISQIARAAEGFVYCVSSLGVTGVRSEITTDVGAMVRLVKEANPDSPCAVGFGSSTPEQAQKMAAISDGAIVGSAIIKLLAQYGAEAPVHVGAYVKSMVDALKGL